MFTVYFARTYIETMLLLIYIQSDRNNNDLDTFIAVVNSVRSEIMQSISGWCSSFGEVKQILQRRILMVNTHLSSNLHPSPLRFSLGYYYCCV